MDVLSVTHSPEVASEVYRWKNNLQPRNFQARTQITVHQGHFESLGHKPLGMEVSIFSSVGVADKS